MMEMSPEQFECQQKAKTICDGRTFTADMIDLGNGSSISQYENCIRTEASKCLGVADTDTPTPKESNNTPNMLQVSPAEMPKMLLATVGGGALGYYLGKGKGQNTQLLYAVVGLVAGFAVYKSFLQSPPKVVAEPAAMPPVASMPAPITEEVAVSANVTV